jgi:hypothetical protein
MIWLFLLGGSLGVFGTLLVQYLLSVKKKKMILEAKKEALKVRVADASTDDLLETLSEREDLTASRTSWVISPPPRWTDDR